MKGVGWAMWAVGVGVVAGWYRCDGIVGVSSL